MNEWLTWTCCENSIRLVPPFGHLLQHYFAHIVNCTRMQKVCCFMATPYRPHKRTFLNTKDTWYEGYRCQVTWYRSYKFGVRIFSGLSLRCISLQGLLKPGNGFRCCQLSSKQHVLQIESSPVWFEATISTMACKVEGCVCCLHCAGCHADLVTKCKSCCPVSTLSTYTSVGVPCIRWDLCAQHCCCVSP